MRRFPSPLAALTPIAPLAILAALATACGATGAEPLGQQADPIINGVPSTADQDYAIGLAILDTNGQYMAGCSGSLIAENLVLTARHCVSQTVGEGVSCSSSGKPLSGTGGVSGDYLPKQLAVLIGPTIDLSGGGFNPKFAAVGTQIFHTSVDNLCNNDIALILLDHKIAGAKLAQLRLDAPPVAGELMTAIGWGVANNTTSQIPSRRTRKDIPVVKVGPANLGVNGGLGPHEFAIGEGICSGDSGGPAVAQTTGAVIGVVSRGGNGAAADPNNPAASCVNTTAADGTTYKASNFYTRIDGFPDLLATAFQAAGAEPWLEGQPDPRKAKFGEPCDGPDACRTALCIGVGAGTQCSQTCDTATPCPTGYGCVSAGTQSVCAPVSADAPATSSSGGCTVGSNGVDAGRASLALTMGLAGLALAVAARRRR